MKLAEIVFCLVFFVGGMVILYFGLGKGYLGAKHFIFGDNVTATVVGNKSELVRSGKNNRRQRVANWPIVAYSVNGEKYEVQLINESYRLGDQVTLSYLSNEPGNAIENSFRSTWLGFLVRTILGLVFCSIGAGLFIYSRK